MRFARTTSALDSLADDLRRAGATRSGAQVSEQWEQLPEPVQERWRGVARKAATTVFKEITAESRPEGTPATRRPAQPGS